MHVRCCTAVWPATALLLVFLVLLPSLLMAAPVPAPAKMRPYTGVGLLILPAEAGVDAADADQAFQLYEEPAVGRLGRLEPGKVPRYEWIFGAGRRNVPVIVTLRRGHWLRIAHDDAGREAWLALPRRGWFQPWEHFLKGKTARLLPGLQKRYYQLLRKPGQGTGWPLTAGQVLKLISLEGDWAQAMSEQQFLGWIRWRDEDGRLLIAPEGLDNSR